MTCSKGSGAFASDKPQSIVSYDPSTLSRYYGFQIKLVFDETTGLSDIEIYDCNNGEAVVESENGGLEQRLSSGAGASGDCLSQVHRSSACVGVNVGLCAYMMLAMLLLLKILTHDEITLPYLCKSGGCDGNWRQARHRIAYCSGGVALVHVAFEACRQISRAFILVE
jgi:hypothetical protein